ncbi:hypothetical protein ACMA1I_06015 [Pontibacter sp. 13R65]|uniref:hypothetical protein n=1 Tax=Pontibacter sp. 13R65 TaxID=3127458 RepID=UPI00301DFE74
MQDYINYCEWVLSPTSFSFKQFVTDPAVAEFDSNNTAYFEVNGMEAYQWYKGPNITIPIDLRHPTYNTSLDVTSATIFLKVLERGENVKLLSYNDMLKTRHFIQEQQQPLLQEL